VWLSYIMYFEMPSSKDGVGVVGDEFAGVW
jgi:hypothetical protein